VTTLSDFSYKVLGIHLTQVTGCPDIPHKCHLFDILQNGTLKQHTIVSCHTNLTDYNTLAVPRISIDDTSPHYMNWELTLGLGSKYFPEQFFSDTYNMTFFHSNTTNKPFPQKSFSQIHTIYIYQMSRKFNLLRTSPIHGHSERSKSYLTNLIQTKSFTHSDT
jgi:hypothetical protein